MPAEFRSQMLVFALASSAAAAGLCAPAPPQAIGASSANLDLVRRQFQNPGKAYRPMVRWWWPGNDVEAGELRREVAELDMAGFGGAEIQPMSMNFPANMPADRHARIFDVGTPAYFANVRTAVDEARKRGMWIDLTLGSGWPAGGGMAVTPERGVTELRYTEANVKGGEHFRGKIALPSLGTSPVSQFLHATMGDPLQPYPAGWEERLKERARTIAVIAFRVQPPTLSDAPAVMPGAPPTIIRSGTLDLPSRIDLTARIAADGSLDWQVPAGVWRIFAFRQVAMDDQVIGGAIPGPKLIVDHFSKDAVDAYLRQFGEPMGKKLSDQYGKGLRALFYDSLEIPADLYWSDDFTRQFETRRGYSIIPYLPLIIQFGYNNGYSAGASEPLYDAPGAGAAVRRDYWKTVGELITEGFYAPFNTWSAKHHLLTRTQAHGAPADLLDVYGRSDIPETEQMATGDGVSPFTSHFTKMASSAADIQGRRIVASESFASGGEPYWTNPAAIKAKTDAFIVAGVNQIVYHGYPYRYDDRPFPGWSAFNNGSIPASFGMTMSSRNSFWPYVPTINAYIGRLQYISQTGSSVTPVAVLATRIGYPMAGMKEPATTAALGRAGYGYSHINAAAILAATIDDGALVTAGGARFGVVVIDDLSWLEPAVAKRLEAAARQGVGVLFVGQLPSESAGYKDHDADSLAVRDAVKAILALPRARHVQASDGVAAALEALVPPNLRFRAGPSLPFIEKVIGAAHAYFVSNPEPTPVKATIEIPAAGSPQLWDPWTGATGPYAAFRPATNGSALDLSLPPHGSALLIFDPADRHPPAAGLPDMPMSPRADIVEPVTGSWTFDAIGHGADGSELRLSRQFPQLIDWARDDRLKQFSGRGTYATQVRLTRAALAKARHVSLDLGEVKDVAEVRINGKPTAPLLMAPFVVDVTGLMRSGVNRIEITAVNALSNAAMPRRPAYPLVDPRMESAASSVPRSSGLLGPVTLRLQY